MGRSFRYSIKWKFLLSATNKNNQVHCIVFPSRALKENLPPNVPKEMITENVNVNNKPSLRVVRLGRASHQAHVGLASLRAWEEARRRDSSEHDRGNEAEETGQVRVNLHKSLDQKGSWANEGARQPVLKAVSRESIANSSPECRPRSMVQRGLVGKREVLLGDSKDVQGEPAAQGNHELIHVDEPGQQHRRVEGVGTQEQESVAGVAFVALDEVSSQQAYMPAQARA